MSFADAVLEGLTATVIGMGMVFGVLAILCVILSFFKYLTPQEKTMQEPEAVPEAAPAEETFEEVSDDSELFAVISAALAAYMGEGATAAIKSIKQVGSGGGTSKAWNVAAIRENHRGVY